MGARVIMLIASTVITPALLYFLGKGQFGQYASVMAVFSLLMILVGSGINSGVRKYLAEEHEDDEHWKDHVFAFYFRLAAVFSLAGAIIVAVGAYTGILSRFMNGSGDYSMYFYLIAVLVVAAQLRSTSRRALMGLKLEHIAEPLQVLNKVLFGVVAIALAALGFGVNGVLLGFIVASLVVCAVSMLLMGRRVDLSYILRPLPDDFPRRELFNFNHLSVVYIFCLTAMYQMDVLILNVFVGDGQTGLYKAALVLVQFLWFVPQSVQSVMLQSTSDLWAKGKLDRIEFIASRVTRYSLLATILMALGLGALAHDFIPLYYRSVDDVNSIILPVLLLLPGTIGFAVARPMLAITQAKGDLKTLIAATGMAAVINIGLNLLLIPRYGMIGAAISTSIGYGSLPLFQIGAARRLGYDPLADARLGRIALTTLLAAVPIIGIPMLIHGIPHASLISIIVVAPIGFVTFAVAAVATGAVGLDEVFDILGSLPEPVSSKATALRSRVSGD